MKNLLLFFTLFFSVTINSQNIVTYGGNSGKETFYDVMQITDGTFLVVGYTENLTWFGSAPLTELSYTGTIPNAAGTNRYGFIMQLSSDMQTILKVVHFPKGVVEDIRFIKTNSQPYADTGDLYISCNTSDSKSNKGGYLLAKLNNNFVNGTPTALSWNYAVDAESITKECHAWDVSSDGNVYYVMGKGHSADWSAIFCLNTNGQQKIVENWRTHWRADGSEIKGEKASTLVTGGGSPIIYSGIALKGVGRCELRSWSAADYNLISADGNGRTKKGKWPMDILFNGSCDNAAPVSQGPGYTGYSMPSAGSVWGATSLIIDRRNNNLYIGMNMRSVLPGGNPDFEPAVMALDNSGSLLWWSRLYHEVSATGVVNNSTPDQYVDALAVDYTNNKLVVGARSHGNNVENLWSGNKVAANPSASGFQNQFTGTNGNIHISWIGKLGLTDGTLSNSTYMAELNEGLTNFGAPLTDPNLAGWPNPNSGWANLNTTRMAKNSLKVAANGDVCVVSVGRRTMTTANAYQKNINPLVAGSGTGAWNNFVRVYDSNLSVPKYSSLVVGTLNPTDGSGGNNTELFGVFKTKLGVVAVGRQNYDAASPSLSAGNTIPVTNVPQWGSALPSSESAILVYYKADNLNESTGVLNSNENQLANNDLILSPNPANTTLRISGGKFLSQELKFEIFDLSGRTIKTGIVVQNTVPIRDLLNGNYIIKFTGKNSKISKRFVKID